VAELLGTPAAAFERVPDLEREARLGRQRFLTDLREIRGHARAQLRIALTVAANELDLLRGVGGLEALPRGARGVGGAVGPAVSLAPGARLDDLRVLARRRPPRSPLTVADDALQGLLDLGARERP